jgi:multifunctional beta-oxidation protein
LKVAKLKPEYIAPTIVLLGSDKCPTTCALFEVGPGFSARVRWERTAGVHFLSNKPLTPEDIASRWNEITDFSSGSTHPDSPADATSFLMQGAQKANAAATKGASGNKVLEKAQSIKISPGEYKYDNQEGKPFHLKTFLNS